MSSLPSFTTGDIINVGRLKSADDYENISRQQLENIFTTPSVSIPTPIPISKPRPRPKPRPAIKFHPPQKPD